MNLWKRVRSLSLRQLTQLVLLFLRNPRFTFATVSATQRTFEICNAMYGTEHQKSNPANAFRHALWNVLICKNSLKVTKNVSNCSLWAQKVTDLYEKVTQNDALDEAMDLHNNRLGRTWFQVNYDKSEAEFIDFLRKKTQKARKIQNLNEITNFPNDLVFIES